MSGCLRPTGTICFQHYWQSNRHAAASHSHVSETGDASLSTLHVAPAQRLLAVCCPTAQRRVDMSDTQLVKIDEVNPACDLWQTSSKRSAYT